MNQLVCLSTTPWSAAPGRTQQLMARMRNAEVLYFEPAHAGNRRNSLSGRGRRVRPNVTLYTMPYDIAEERLPGLLQARMRRKAADFITGKLIRHGFQKPVLWLTRPEQVFFLDALSFSGLIYDCDRYWPDGIAREEGALAAAADVVFTASQGILDRLSPCNKNLVLLPGGVNYPMFSRTEYDCPPELRDLHGPVLGFAGAIVPKLDLSPLETAARLHPDWNILLVGRTGKHPRLPSLSKFPNVRIPGVQSLFDLPDYMGRFDVCLALRRSDERESDIVPDYIYQYFSTGKPIVAMLWPDEVEEYPDVIYAAHTPEEFVRLCSEALSEDRNWVSNRRRDYGKAAAWSARSEEVIRILGDIGLYHTEK